MHFGIIVELIMNNEHIYVVALLCFLPAHWDRTGSEQAVIKCAHESWYHKRSNKHSVEGIFCPCSLDAELTLEACVSALWEHVRRHSGQLIASHSPLWIPTEAATVIYGAELGNAPFEELVSAQLWSGCLPSGHALEYVQGPRRLFQIWMFYPSKCSTINVQNYPSGLITG